MPRSRLLCTVIEWWICTHINIDTWITSVEERKILWIEYKKLWKNPTKNPLGNNYFYILSVRWRLSCWVRGIFPKRLVWCKVSVCGGASRGWDEHMSGGRLFCSQMSCLFRSHTDGEENIMLKTVFNKSTVLVVAVSWCGQESIMVEGRLLCMRQVHWRASDIEMRS